MVSDQEIARGVETVLQHSDPNGVTTLKGVVQQLEAKLGLDLSHKAVFIRDQITLILQSQPPPPPTHQKDHAALQKEPHYYPRPQFHHPNFAFQRQQPQHHHLHQAASDLNFQQPPPEPVPPSPVSRALPLPHSAKQGANVGVTNASSKTKDRAPAATKRKGGAGGLNKMCGVSPELQAIVGEPTLSRTEIVKALWAYIRKNNLQDPSNKRKIICDDALRLVFETDATDMFKMNKLLSKHILPLEAAKETSHQAKRSKVEAETLSESSQRSGGPPTVRISEALAKFLGTKEREMLQLEAMRRVWDYIRANHLEDPINSMAILCDEKLQELVGCESISALGMSELLVKGIWGFA